MQYNLIEATSNGHWEYYLIEVKNNEEFYQKIRTYRHIKTDSIQVISENKEIVSAIMQKIRLTLSAQSEIITS